MDKIIQREKSIIPACDVPLDLYEKIVKDTTDVDCVGAYKIGFELGLSYGLPKVVELTRKYNDKPIIYDHQKAGTDIPATGKKFARIMRNAGVDAVILFPRTNDYKTHEAWVKASQDQGLGVIVGGEMTHQQNPPHYSEIMDIYSDAASFGVKDFVVPGNKPESIRRIRVVIEDEIELTNVAYYAPGFVAQGGVISEGAKAAGKRFHAIVGRTVYTAQDIRKAAVDLSSKL